MITCNSLAFCLSIHLRLHRFKFLQNPKISRSVSTNLLILSRSLGIDHRQFLVLAETPADFIGSITCTVLILEYANIAGVAAPTGTSESFKGAADAYAALAQMAASSHPLLRWIGISRISFFPNTSAPVTGISGKPPEVASFFSERKRECPIKYPLTDAPGTLTDYVPLLHPDALDSGGAQDEMKSIFTGKSLTTSVTKLATAHADPEDDDLYFGEDAAENSELSVHAQRARFVLERGLYKGDDPGVEEKWYFDADYNHLKEKRMPGASNLQAHTLSWWVIDEHDPDKDGPGTVDFHKTNERMLFCIKTLGQVNADTDRAQATSDILSPIAQRFWNGSMGISSFENVVKGVLRRGLDDAFLFRGVDVSF